MQISKLKIKNYSNYRDFLIDYVNFKKTNPQWSLGVWKRQLKLKSVSTLTMILKGQRDPGPRLIQSFNQYFKFNEEEKNYFESLVGLQKKVKNISPSMRMLLGSPEILAQESHQTETPFPEHLLFKRLTHVIREMTLIKNFQPNSKWISQNILNPISAEIMNEYIEKLIQSKLLNKTTTGELKIPSMAVTTRPENPQVLINFHQEILTSSVHALTQVSENEKSFNVTFLNIRADRLAEAKKKIQEFQNEFSHLFEECPGDSVYQLSVQFFPATRRSQNV